MKNSLENFKKLNNRVYSNYKYYVISDVRNPYLLHESECDVVKYFISSRIIYFHEREVSENIA